MEKEELIRRTPNWLLVWTPHAEPRKLQLKTKQDSRRVILSRNGFEMFSDCWTHSFRFIQRFHTTRGVHDFHVMQVDGTLRKSIRC